MTSTLGCIGLDVASEEELFALVEAAPPERVVALAQHGPVTTWRWEDPSGARLTFEHEEGPGGGVLHLVPSYAGAPGAWLSGLAQVEAEIGHADVLDEAGALVTRAALDVEPYRQADVAPRGPWPASLTALGLLMTVHPDEAAFTASPDSWLEAPEPGEEPAPDGPRIGAESFFSLGLWGSGEDAPHARMAGRVLHAATRTHTATGQTFHVARVRTVDVEVDLCLAADDHPLPVPGGVVAGYAYVVAGADHLWGRRRLLGRRRRR